MSDIRYFLLGYDPAAGDLMFCQEFAEQDEAVAAYADAEKHHRGDLVRVLLFSADSLDAVKRTHPHYFEEAQDGNTAPFPAAVP